MQADARPSVAAVVAAAFWLLQLLLLVIDKNLMLYCGSNDWSGKVDA